MTIMPSRQNFCAKPLYVSLSILLLLVIPPSVVGGKPYDAKKSTVFLRERCQFVSGDTGGSSSDAHNDSQKWCESTCFHNAPKYSWSAVSCHLSRANGDTYGSLVQATRNSCKTTCAHKDRCEVCMREVYRGMKKHGN